MDLFTVVILLIAPSFCILRIIIQTLKCCKIKTARDISFDYDEYTDENTEENTQETREENNETGTSELTVVVEDTDNKSDDELPRYNELF